MKLGSIRVDDRLLRTLFVVGFVWIVLLLAQIVLTPLLGRSYATAASFVVATAIVVMTQSNRPPSISWRPLVAVLLGASAGIASHGAWVSIIAWTGISLGLAVPRVEIGEVDEIFAIASILFAPVFEEILYRERLQGLLVERVGVISAILLSSSAFAIVHVEPWAVLGTFLVGLMLGSVMWLSGWVAICIGLHAGLNLSFALYGWIPILQPSLGALVGALLVAIAMVLSGRGSAPALRRNPFAGATG